MMEDEAKQMAAAQAADTVAKAAAAAATAVANAASIASSALNVDIGYIKRDIGEIKDTVKGLAGVYVTRAEFDADLEPIRKDLTSIQGSLSWLVRVIIGAVILAVLGLIFVQK